MVEIKLSVHIVNGKIELSEEQKHYESIIDYLIDYPFDIPNPIRLTRDELYKR